MGNTTTRKEKREQRHQRVRARVQGTAALPRLYVFKSNQHIYCGVVDDTTGFTIASASDISVKAPNAKKADVARLVGEAIGKTLREKGVQKIVFDRGGYRYQGNIKAVAEGARSAGLIF
jgi:large subunit ribosomal protein L18